MAFSELRYACRSLRAQPLWTAAAVVCLAIGTGANTASLSVINAILLRPLPFAGSERLAVVGLRDTNPPQNRVFSLAEYREVAPRVKLFSELAARTFLPVSVSAGDAARMVQSEMVSSNYFDMLRVLPLLGQLPRGQAEAMLSERLWRSRFASDPGLVGRTVRVNGRPIVVTGIAPAGFIGATQLIAADMWLPADFSGSDTTAQFGVIGRLAPGATREQARLEVNAILAGIAQARGSNAAAVARVEEATGFGFPLAARPAAAVLFGLIGLVMCVAVANVAGLMLARAPARRREISLRLALGASPSRIVRMVLVESLILGVVGSTIGAVLAAILMHVTPGLAVHLPEHLNYAVDVRTDGRVLVYAAITAIAVSILFGLAPALQAARTSFVHVLKQTGTSTTTAGSARALSTLVIGQMAVSTALLVGAVLLARTYVNAQSADPGIDTRNVLALDIDLDQAGYNPASSQLFYERLLQRVAGMPGIESATLTSETPLAPKSGAGTVTVELDEGKRSAESKLITQGYFGVLRIPIVQGRNFAPGDRGTAIINETMAQQFWPGRSALGQTFRTAGALLEVIGVAKDIKYRSLVEAPRAVF
jgi:putative ABC transport system permease protein